MKKFNQLSPGQRYQIEILNKDGSTQTQIAKLIGVHKSTVSRKLRRNAQMKGGNMGGFYAPEKGIDMGNLIEIRKQNFSIPTVI